MRSGLEVDDPYRTDAVGELRQLVVSSVANLGGRVCALPPAKLERLAMAIAWFEGEGDLFDHPLEIVQALQRLDHRDVHDTAVCCSELITLEPGKPHEENMGARRPGDPPMLARSLRIEVEGSTPADLEFSIRGTNRDICILERCPVSEYAQLTSIDPFVFTAECPLRVIFHPCETLARVRVVIRGDRRQPQIYPGMTLPLDHVGHPFVPNIGPGPVCPTCSRARGPLVPVSLRCRCLVR